MTSLAEAAQAAGPALLRAMAVSALFAALWVNTAAAQSIVCCNQMINVRGDWIGTGRVADCQEYFDTAPPEIARRMCKQRRSLGCLDMRRCSELPGGPDDEDWPEDAETAAPPGDPAARGGLDDGFDEPSEPTRPHPTAPPKRLVYLIFPPERADQSVVGFKSWLDGAGCALALQEAPEENAEQVVWGRLVRGADGARVELRARDLYERTVTDPVVIPVESWDRSAIAAAIRQARERLGLLCRR